MGTVNVMHSETKAVYTFTLADDGARIGVRPAFDEGEYSPEEATKMLEWAEKEQQHGHWRAAPMQPADYRKTRGILAPEPHRAGCICGLCYAAAGDDMAYGTWVAVREATDVEA